MWTVYILQCSDNTLYTGITNNLPRRYNQHNSGKGAKYTRSRTPVSLVYESRIYNTRGEALVEEIRIKRLTRKQKMKLVGEAYGLGF